MDIYLITTMYGLTLGVAKLHTERIPVMPYSKNTFHYTVTWCVLTIKLRSPVRMVDTLHAGFQVSG
jgi:hypothetical protein